MLQTPSTGTWYRSKENTVITCDFIQFQATLTGKRLIINHKEATDSYPLSRIRAVTVFDDYEKYSLKTDAFKRKRRRLYRSICITVTAGLLCYFLPQFLIADLIAGAALGITLSSILPIRTYSVAIPSLLLVILEDHTKEYEFRQHRGIRISSIARFLLCMEEALKP